MSTRAVRLSIVALLSLSQGLGPGLTAFALPLILRAHGLSLAEAGLSTLLIWPVMLKFLIGPAIDRAQADGSSRRWLLAPLQLGFTCCFVVLALTPPSASLAALLVVIALLNVLAAVLDVALGGFAVRVLAPVEQSMGQSVQLIAYYAGTIAASGGLLTLAEAAGWQVAVLALALVAAASTVAGFFARGIEGSSDPAPRLNEFRPAPGFLHIAVIALFLDLPQNVGIALLGPFLNQGGLSIAEAARVTGGIGLVAAAAGAAAGGLWARRSENRTARLAVLGAAQCAALLPLAALTLLGSPPYVATVAAVCLATAAAAAFNATLGAWFMDRVRSATAATELALLASLHGLSYVVAGPLAGSGAEWLGTANLLALAALAGGAALSLLCLPARSRSGAAATG